VTGKLIASQSSPVVQLKSDLRKRIIAAREAMPPAARHDFSARITSRLFALPSYRDARCVAAYVGFGSEFDTGAFIADVLARGKELALPRVERATRSLKLYAVRDPAAELVPGVWGIREPRPDLCAEVPLAAVDFVLVPGVAFTARGERLGYGSGYYDRLIHGLGGRAVLAVGAFGLQVVPEVPVTPTDQRVDLVVTEEAEHSSWSEARKKQEK
jgi:5-formyltetrahydrofolate cyclo-ligase